MDTENTPEGKLCVVAFVLYAHLIIHTHDYFMDKHLYSVMEGQSTLH